PTRGRSRKKARQLLERPFSRRNDLDVRRHRVEGAAHPAQPRHDPHSPPQPNVFLAAKNMTAPPQAYASTPSTNPPPAVINETPSTSAVPITATIRSIRSSRARARWTWSPTGAPQAGQRPAGLRTSGAAQCGHSITDAIGTPGL